MGNTWKHCRSRWSGDEWQRQDGVIIYRPSARSRFRVHRPNAVGFGFENLVGSKGTALTFKTVDAAIIATDQKW